LRGSPAMKNHHEIPFENRLRESLAWPNTVPSGTRIRHGLPNPSELPHSFWLCPLLVLVTYWRCPLVSAQMGYRWHQRSGGRGRNLSPSEQSPLSPLFLFTSDMYVQIYHLEHFLAVRSSLVSPITINILQMCLCFVQIIR
jgi:hypothetical protein